jgi:AAA15 family ATPase/GTPase
MVNAENGYLFIDEVENGLHYSVQIQLWEVIFFLAKELNVQVFATTHSSDAVAAFSLTATENKNTNLGKVIRLQRKNEKLSAVVFAQDDLKIAYEQDLNLR